MVTSDDGGGRLDSSHYRTQREDVRGTVGKERRGGLTGTQGNVATILTYDKQLGGSMW